MSLLGDESDAMFAQLAYGGEAHQPVGAHFASGLQSPLPDADASAATSHFSMDAHMHAHTFDGDIAMDAHLMLKSETQAPLLDPFGFEAPCSPLLHDEHQLPMHIHTGNIMHANAEMDHTLNRLEMDAGAVPMPQLDHAAQAPIAMPAMLPFQPLPVAHLAQVASVAPRGRKAVAAVSVKREPVSPSISTITSPASRLTSPSMPPLHTAARVVMPVAAVAVAGAASPVMHMAARSSSSAGDSASAGSGGSGSNSAAQSCSSASDSDSDTAFDEPARKKKAGVKQQGRKRKIKAGSGNSSGTEQGGAPGSAGSSVGDDLLERLEREAAINAGMPGEVPTENKRQQRLQRNRASAQLSRERKKQYMKLLEKQLKELAELNEGLSFQIRELTSENTRLKTKLSSLAMRERVASRYPGTAAQALRGSNPAPYASSQASTASMHSSPHHHARMGSGDVESLGAHSSGPATPASEVEAPQAKRLKVQAYGPPHSPSSGSPSPSSGGSHRPAGSFNARAGMLLFTLVMSVGLLYNWAGVDMAQVNQNFDLAAGTAGAGVAVATVPLGHSPAVGGQHRATLELMSDAPGAEDAVAHRSHAHLTATVPARGRVLASIASEVEADGNSSDQDAFALVPLSHSSSAATTSPMQLSDEGDDDSKAIDVYTRVEMSVSDDVIGHGHGHARGHGHAQGEMAAAARTHLGLDRKSNDVDVQLLRRLLLSAGGNSTSAASESSNYMFCPSSLSISRDAWAGLLHKHNIVLNHSANGGDTPSDLTDHKQLALFEEGDGGSAGSKRSRSGKKKSSAGRLRKVIGLPALPAPGSSADLNTLDSLSSGASSLLLSDLSALPSVSSGLQVGDKLLLWVPLQLASSQPNGTVADDADQTPKQGLVEIACQIAHVRPIVMS